MERDFIKGLGATLALHGGVSVGVPCSSHGVAHFLFFVVVGLLLVAGFLSSTRCGEVQAAWGATSKVAEEEYA